MSSPSHGCFPRELLGPKFDTLLLTLVFLRRPVLSSSNTLFVFWHRIPRLVDVGVR